MHQHMNFVHWETIVDCGGEGWHKREDHIRVFDAFMFFNELDVLEVSLFIHHLQKIVFQVRLNELDPYVDIFILCEATKTHQVFSHATPHSHLASAMSGRRQAALLLRKQGPLQKIRDQNSSSCCRRSKSRARQLVHREQPQVATCGDKSWLFYFLASSELAFFLASSQLAFLAFSFEPYCY